MAGSARTGSGPSARHSHLVAGSIPAAGSMAKCKSCNARILWARTNDGKSMPVNHEPVPDGNIVLRDGRAIVLTAAQLAVADDDQPRFKAHFATCPNAAQHRKAVVRG
jgi:hypothetical protein